MLKFFSRRIVSILVVGVFTLGIAACGSSSDSPSGTTASGSGTSSSSGLPDSAAIPKIKSAGELKVGVATTPPFILQDPDTKEYVGPGATLANAIADRLGVKVKWVPETYDTIIAALQANQIDLADAPLYATPERLKVIDMSAWAKDGFCYLTKKSSSINSLDQLNSSDVTMGNITGTGTFTATAAKYPKAKQVKRVASPGEQALIPELVSGKVDVDPVDATLVGVYLAKYSQLRVVPEGCSATSNPDIPTPIAVGYRKGDKGFGKFVDQVIAANSTKLQTEVERFSAPKYMNARIGG
jgi:ABC-type amino acid transport substrate-binding protein